MTGTALNTNKTTNIHNVFIARDADEERSGWSFVVRNIL